jgi:hypothetical protein
VTSIISQRKVREIKIHLRRIFDWRSVKIMNWFFLFLSFIFARSVARKIILLALTCATLMMDIGKIVSWFHRNFKLSNVAYSKPTIITQHDPDTNRFSSRPYLVQILWTYVFYTHPSVVKTSFRIRQQDEEGNPSVEMFHLFSCFFHFLTRSNTLIVKSLSSPVCGGIEQSNLSYEATTFFLHFITPVWRSEN